MAAACPGMHAAGGGRQRAARQARRGCLVAHAHAARPLGDAVETPRHHVCVATDVGVGWGERERDRQDNRT